MTEAQVKPLEWLDMTYGMQPHWIARYPFGMFDIRHETDQAWPWVVRPFITELSNYKTLKEAKAAAETEYTDRIRSALVPAPAVPDDVAKVQAMQDANWKPAVQYWREKADAALAREKALREALRRLSTATCFGSGEVLGMDLNASPMGREVLARMEFARAAPISTATAPQTGPSKETAMSEDLKPCPFCGEAAEWEIDHTIERNDACGCPNCGLYFDTFNSDDPAASWNRRVKLAEVLPPTPTTGDDA